MEKILISLPYTLAARMRATIPPRQRNNTITHLIEEEINRREQIFSNCALLVEKDCILFKEMADRDSALNDGLDDGLRQVLSL